MGIGCSFLAWRAPLKRQIEFHKSEVGVLLLPVKVVHIIAAEGMGIVGGPGQFLGDVVGKTQVDQFADCACRSAADPGSRN